MPGLSGLAATADSDESQPDDCCRGQENAVVQAQLALKSESTTMPAKRRTSNSTNTTRTLCQ